VTTAVASGALLTVVAPAATHGARATSVPAAHQADSGHAGAGRHALTRVHVLTRRHAAATGHTAARPATVPGTPGTPQAPTMLYSEDFENGQGTVPVRLTGYQGANGQTYTADPAWLQDCNGWVAAFEDPAGSKPAVASQVADCTPKTGGPGAGGAQSWDAVRSLAQALGILNDSADPNDNHAVSAYTNGPVNSGDPGAGKVEFATQNPIPVSANGRFLTVQANVAELNCTSNHALLRFSLLDQSSVGLGVKSVSSADIDPCAQGKTITTGIKGGTFTGDTPELFTGTALGIQMINNQGTGSGNDHAFDDVKLLDVTPQLDKSFNPVSAQVGGTSTLTFTITNTSDLLAKSGWSLTDTLPAGLTLATPSAKATTCPAGTVIAPDGGTTVGVAGGALNAGQASCTVTVNVTSAAAGTYTNDASDITASAGLNPPGSSTITFTNAPTIGLTKSVSPTWFSAAGQTLAYSFLVSNPSSVTLSAIIVHDTGLPGLSTIACPDPALAAGASETCTATYLTTQQDVNAGSVSNTATATGTPPAGPAVTSPPSAITVPALVPPSITLEKSATPGSFTAAGQVIAFDYLVTNTSPVALSAITVTDTTLRGLPPVNCPVPTLGPGDSEHCTAGYVTTVADVAAGSVTNVATAQGDPPGSTVPVVSAPSSVTVPFMPNPSLALVKTPNQYTFDTAGQVITYSYAVTNTGNVTLTGVHVADQTTGTGTLSAIDCPTATLIPTGRETCTATYTITAADVHAGTVTDTATTEGLPPGATVPVDSNQSTVTLSNTASPALTLDKTADPTSVTSAGDTVDYSFVIANSGNVPVSDISVNEASFSGSGTLSAIDCPDSALAPTASETCTATYDVTEADLEAGTVLNTAVATGTAPDGDTVTSGPSSAVVATGANPGITLVKSAAPSTFDAAGQTIRYSLLVSNTGNVTLTDITVTDDDFSSTGEGDLGPLAVACPSDVLAPKHNMTCTADYVVTQADLDAGGSLANTANVSGTDPSGGTESAASTTVVRAVQAPALTLDKTADPTSVTSAGDTVNYSFVIANSGNVTVTGISVDDSDFSGTGALSDIVCPLTTLGPRDSTTCTATYTVTRQTWTPEA
jgi:uncharacterized repeat protein (TIGR01451 family)